MAGWQALSRPSAAEGGGRRPAFTGLATWPYSATEVDGWQHKLSRVSQNRAAVHFLSALFAGAIYWVHGDIEYNVQGRSMSPAAIAHGSVLLGFFFTVTAWSYFLDRHLLLYRDNGVVVGASYTDIHVELPVLWLLVGFSVAAAFAAWANTRVRTYRLPLAAALLVFGGSFVLSSVVAGAFQRVFVKPEELQREKPYIERNIALTQQAYNLHQITAKPFPADQDLTFKTLEANKATVDNIRLWDWQPLMDTYAQLQEIRTYYKFHDVDADRYRLDGDYRGVMLSARELKASLLPPNAQTWVNRHVLFTHGNGAVMSPVNRKSAEGLPLFYLSDIPPVATGGPAIREPRIYTGKRPTAMSSSRGARRSSIIRREKTTSTRPITVTVELPWARSRGESCSPGTFATSTCCSRATSPVTAGS
jgi:uncharacterized protein